MAFIEAYAPTDNSGAGEKDRFFTALEEALAKCRE